MEQLNGNLHFQYFCYIVIPFDAPITNFKTISQIWCELAHKIKIRELQEIHAQAWKPLIKVLYNLLVDATCYQSEVRYL